MQDQNIAIVNRYCYWTKKKSTDKKKNPKTNRNGNAHTKIYEMQQKREIHSNKKQGKSQINNRSFCLKDLEKK